MRSESGRLCHAQMKVMRMSVVTILAQFLYIFVIRLEARLRPNIGFTVAIWRRSRVRL